jgi:hypothetical protein
LESIKELYVTDFDFNDAYDNYTEGRTWNKYMLHDGLLYYANKLCVPASSIHLLCLQVAHGSSLMGHFGVKKTEDVLAAHFFWSKMWHDVEHYMSQCTTCNKAKSQLNPHDLYMSLSVPNVPNTRRWRDSIFVVVDRFSKMAYFIPYHKI